MKKQTLFFLLFSFFTDQVIFAQTPNLSSEKRKQDESGFEKFKKAEPELFLNKRLPVKLLDGNFYVKGYSDLGIRLTNTHLLDSVYHNFHLGKAEKDLIPYNNIKITGNLASVDLISNNVFTEAARADSGQIINLDTSLLQKGFLDNHPVTFRDTYFSFVNTSSQQLPDTININSLRGKDLEVRVSLNGKLLFDWSPLTKFAHRIVKSAQKWPPTQYGPFWIVSYGYIFHIADQKLALNDQLLIEIKENKKGWMLDRFNITRIAATPTIAKVVPTASWDNGNIEKKTLR